MQSPCLTPTLTAKANARGPLSEFRRRPVKCRNPAIAKPGPGERTAWTVDHMPGAPLVGSLAEASRLAGDYNTDRPDGAPVAVPTMVRAVVYKPSLKHPGCETVEFDVPSALWKVFRERCELVNVDPSRLVSSLILQHCVKRDPDNFGDGMLRFLAGWETSKKRGVRPWPKLKTVRPVDGKTFPANPEALP